MIHLSPSMSSHMIMSQRLQKDLRVLKRFQIEWVIVLVLDVMDSVYLGCLYAYYYKNEGRNPMKPVVSSHSQFLIGALHEFQGKEE